MCVCVYACTHFCATARVEVREQFQTSGLPSGLGIQGSNSNCDVYRVNDFTHLIGPTFLFLDFISDFNFVCFQCCCCFSGCCTGQVNHGTPVPHPQPVGASLIRNKGLRTNPRLFSSMCNDKLRRQIYPCIYQKLTQQS